jgi:hypothetical protein
VKRKTWFKWIAVAVVAALIAAPIGFVVWTRAARYAAFPEASSLVTDAVRTPQGWLAFTPDQPDGTGLIIYPGGLVDPAAYAPLAKRFAERGVLAVIAPMPLDLAIFGLNQAGAIIAAYPEIERWIMAGHSLGGSMAAQFLAAEAARQPKIVGLSLWASFAPDGADLSSSGLKAASIFGSNDGVMTLRDPDTLLKGLPPGTAITVIEGGNHAGFGAYGPQQGDGPAAITPEAQQEQTVDATLSLLAAP